MSPCRLGLLAALSISLALPADWPLFHSSNRSGVADAKGLPVNFGSTENVAWKVDVPFGPPSPFVTGNRIFLPATGKQRWRIPRPESRESGSVPLAHQDQLIGVDAYQPSTGEKRWWSHLPSNCAMGSSVLFDHSVIVTASGSDKPGLPSFAATLAKFDQNTDQKVSLPEGHCNPDNSEHFGALDKNEDGGIDSTEWETTRQMGIGEYGAYFASPVAADGTVDTVTAEGKMTVLQNGPQWERLALNDLADKAFSSPAIVGNRLLVRTRNTLFNFPQIETK